MILKNKIAIIGLGYVGLPLAVAFSNKFKVTGYDINSYRIENLKKNNDFTKEISKIFLKKQKLKIYLKTREISDCNIYIITVPTPIYSLNQI